MMNEKRTPKSQLGRTALLAASILVILGGSAGAQQTLRELAEEYGCNWLAGNWVATTDNGGVIELAYKWELDGHLVTVEFKMGEYASRGMIYYVPGEENATAVSVDNRGGRSKGTWQAQDGKLIAKSERIDTEGNVRKSAVVYTNVDAKTMRVAIHGLDDNGELSYDARFSMDFKRKTVKKKQ